MKMSNLVERFEAVVRENEQLKAKIKEQDEFIAELLLSTSDYEDDK